MATKGDLVEAQRYSRRRLRTAFTSGIPRGVELEPKNHLRAVVGGTAVAVLMIVGSMLFGYIKPGLPEDWENNRLLVGSATGARYLSMDGTLYPVANLASARLLAPAGALKVDRIDERRVDGKPRGPMVGIVGAPDFLPRAESLVNTGWNACAVEGSIALTMGPSTSLDPVPADQAAVVRVVDSYLLLMGGYRYALPEPEVQRTAVLRALSLDTATVVEVSAQWVNLFTPGAPIIEWGIPFAGDAVHAVHGLTIGEILVFDSEGEGQKYVVTDLEELAPVSEFALLLYGHDYDIRPQVRKLSQGDVDDLPAATKPVADVSDNWPDSVPVPVEQASALCATLTTDASGATVPALAIASASDLAKASTGYLTPAGHLVASPPAGGALVSAPAVRGATPRDTDTVYLVDALGTAYPIPDVDQDVLARLGYSGDDIGQVPPGWVETFTPGPALTIAAARAVVGPSAGEVTVLAPSPTPTPTEG